MTQTPKPSIVDLLPKELTPAQRAILKLAWHAAIIFLFNTALAATTYFASANHEVNWTLLSISAISQGVIAVSDALKKYYSAHGDVSLSTLFGLFEAEVAAKSPTIQYTPNEQALQQSVATALLANDAPPAAQTSVYSAVPTDLKATGGELPTQAPESAEPTTPAPGGNYDSLPAIPAIAKIP